MRAFDTGDPNSAAAGSSWPAMLGIGRYGLPAALGFGIGSVFPLLGFFLPGPLGFIGMIGGFALNGLIGGMAIGSSAGAALLLPAIAFGIGFIPTAIVVMVTMVAEASGGEALLVSASGCAVGYGIAGAIGMPCLGSAMGFGRVRTLAFLVFAGGIAFAIGGAVGGLALAGLSSASHVFRGLIGIPIAGAVGGFLLGATLVPAARIET